jgi:hypothetical protein
MNEVTICTIVQLPPVGVGQDPPCRSSLARRGARATAAAAVVVLALLVTACSGAGPGTAVKSSTYVKALAYSQCMRSHGVPGWPDPNSQGLVDLSQVQQIPDTPQLMPAEAACAHLQPSSRYVQVSSAQMQKLAAEGLKYSNCMRTHGIPGFPDPDPGHLQNGVVGWNTGGIDVSSPQFLSGQKACKALLPGNA